ncbi:MAG: Gfo/Idh/MocA family oxidoreductase [Chloroflexi bacterium]|nr:Gfo/Idh/MocA family oxidoreductase [Chloroflexota bacterium]
MTTQPLRWGLLSTARINRALIPPLRSSKCNHLLAVASRTKEQADVYAREWDIPRAFGSYQAMLDDPDIDVVYISLPNSLHAEWTIKAARAGKHVLCEKPLALSILEVENIAAAKRENNVVIAEAFMYRHHPQTLKAQELVEGGVIGELRLIRGCFTFNLTRETDHHLDPAMGGGSLWDVGCYPVSFARYLVRSEPLEVSAMQVTGPSGVDEVFAGQMQFAGNILAQFDCGFRSPFRAQMEIVGSEGSLTIPTPFKPGRREKILLTHNGKVETIRVPGQELYLGEVEDMADAILLGKPPRVSLTESRGNVATILALLESARTKQAIWL